MSVPSMSVGQCLRAARNGSSDALGAVLQAYRHYLLMIANQEIDRALQGKGGASDLVQETFLEAARDFDRFQGDSPAELRAWLRCMLLRRVAKQGRRFHKTSKRRLSRECSLEALRMADDESALFSGRPTPSQNAVAEEELHRLHQALEQLTSDHRRVVQLRYQEGRTFAEIGLLMGRSTNAVRLLWLRAVERIKHTLEADADG